MGGTHPSANVEAPGVVDVPTDRKGPEAPLHEVLFVAGQFGPRTSRCRRKSIQRTGAAGPDGAITDDLATVKPWGFDLSGIVAPVLLVQGGEDRVVPPSHADWLLRHIPTAELWLRPRAGHVSVLDAAPVAMDWLRAEAHRR